MAIGTVQTRFGRMEGVACTGRYTGITLFKGIPYAAPPVGRLRFAPPEDPTPWTGVRVCDTYGRIAIQSPLSDRHQKEYYFGGVPEMSEDCLYLNICTGAASAAERRPVYLWFHGGGLTNCYAYEVQFDPVELARKGVVVVSIGQRLGLFGYLALPRLSAEQEGRSGNYGFMDQLKALDWVAENIEAFGGDPENITIGGQSGGSLKTCAMAASPASRGRVRRVINQSGLKWMWPFRSRTDAERQGGEYLQYIGLDPDLSLDRLRAIDAFELYRDVPRAVMPGDLVHDGVLLPYPSVRECFEHDLGRTDFINGCNLGEADVFAESQSGLNPAPVRAFSDWNRIDTAAAFYAHFRNLLGELYERFDFESKVPVTDATAWDTARLLAVHGLAGSEGTNVNRSLMLNRVFGKYLAARRPGSRVYSYLWSHLLPIDEAGRGTDRDSAEVLAWHSSELWFTFNSLRENTPPTRPWRDCDFRMGDIVSSFWGNFIRTGDPNGEGLPFWPASSEDFGYIELKEGFPARQGLSGTLDPLLRAFVRREYQQMRGKQDEPTQ